MRRLIPTLIGAGALAVSLFSGPAQAGKDNDTLVWTTDRDVETLLQVEAPPAR